MSIVLLTSLIFSSITLADVWNVDLNGNGDYSEIQPAIDNAIDGDTIIVEQGVYRGDRNTNLNFHGKAITLKSSKGSTKTIIDCLGHSDIYDRDTRGFYFVSGEDANSVVDGFTVRNGKIWGDGGGIYCWNSSPTILNCIIENCYAERGGGFVGYNCKSIFKNCQFKNNEAGNDGGGLLIESYGSELVLEQCIIKNNRSCQRGGGISLNGGLLNLYNCLLSGNVANDGAAISSGGGFHAYNCTFVRNKSGYSIFDGGWSSILTNCIVWDNEPQQIYPYDMYCYYSIVQGGAEGHEVWDIDPLVTADGHLQKESPGIDAGDPYWFLNVADFDGDYPNVDSRTDIGCDQYVDSDQDGLPDWWELKYYGGITAADPSSDGDNDGDTALEEYQNSTNPLGAYYVATNGNDNWDGLASEWDGLHGPKATIQDAVDSVEAGAEIIVNDGVYTGVGNRDIYLVEREVYLHSANGPETCVIDCNGTPEDPHFGFSITSAAGSAQTVLEGFTVTNACSLLEETDSLVGAVNLRGGGNPIIKNCNISGNNATGIVTRTTESSIVDCRINHNIGGGIQVFSLSGYHNDPMNPKVSKITNCIIAGNFSDGPGSAVSIQRANYPGVYPVFTNCVIAGNYSASGQGAIYQESSAGVFMNCTVAENMGGGFYYLYMYSPMIRNLNTIISQNSPYDLSPDYGYWPGQESCFIGSETDPLFRAKGIWSENINPELITSPEQMQAAWIPGDYHLRPDSPCVDTGINEWAMDYFDIDDNGIGREEELPFDMDWKIRIADGNDDGNSIVDIGAYEYSNHPPIAEAGPNQICYAWIDGLAQVQLDGSESDDLDGDKLSYLWSWAVDEIAYEANGVSPVIDLPTGVHEIQLVVNDGFVDSQPDYLTCNVIPPIKCNGTVNPKVLSGKGKKMQVIIELPESIFPEDISDSKLWTIEPMGIAAIKSSFASRKGGTDYLLVDFNKSEVINGLVAGSSQIDIVGILENGRYIFYSDSIIIKK